MISVDEAIKILVQNAAQTHSEAAPLRAAQGRILSRTVSARHSQPAQAVSAMDGYAVRFSDLQEMNTFNVIGDAPAGRPFGKNIGPGETVRLFTGSVVPDGADHVVIQEDTSRSENVVTITEPQTKPRHIRAAGIDFAQDQKLGEAGDELGPFQIAALASAGHGSLSVFKRPRIGIIANGDELREPGEPLSCGDVACSTPYGLIPLIESWGGDVHFTGIAADTPEAIAEKIALCDDDDILLPIGGASVGDHDHMRATFKSEGWETVFEKIAVKPGKPTWFAAHEDRRALGLPGNPASALVCAILFLKPLVFAMTGRSVSAAHAWRRASVPQGIPSNGGRESFLRARREYGADGLLTLTPAGDQDSSLITPFLDCDALIRRPAKAPEISPGSSELVDYLAIM